MRLDLRHLARTLRRSPASALAAIVTLALTLGAVASIAAIVDAVLLTPPPVRDPHQLAVVGEIPLEDRAATPRAVPYATFEAWRERASALAALEAFDGTNLTMTERGTAERLSATDVTPGFLNLLGVAPVLGRTFAPDDVGQPVAIISDRFWRTRLAGDSGVIGRSLTLGGRSHTIIGVLPERFVFALAPAEIWRPLPLSLAQAARTGYRVTVMARLGRNASTTTLGAVLDDVSRTSSPPSQVAVTPVAAAIAGESVTMLTLLGGAAVLAMIIAFTNLAGLLMVRSLDRRRELTVRSALGAHPSEIAWQLLMEGFALVAIGIAAGVLLAVWVTPVLARLALQQFGSLSTLEIGVSWRVIAMMAAAAFACAGLCGLLPALGAARRSTVDVLRRGTTPSKREQAIRRLFVTGEVALAFVLLVSMALLGRSLSSLLRVDPGFDARGVLAMQLSLPTATYDSDERVASFYSTLHSALQPQLAPGDVAVIDEIPLTGDRGRSVVRRDPSSDAREAVVRSASPGYFDVMKVPVLAGRTFAGADNGTAPARAVISRALADVLFAGDSAVGRQLSLGPKAIPVEIIGVVGDVKLRTLDETVLPTLYLSNLQSPSPSSVLVVRSTRPDSDTIAAVRAAVAQLDANLPVYRVRSMSEVVSASPGVPARQLLTATFSGFALLALVLSAIGLFGVAAHDVASRHRELALRLALGADPMGLLRATLVHSAWMIGIGLAAGALLSFWAARGLGSFISTSGQADLVGVIAAATILVATGVAAVLPSALRAARTDPLLALRSE